MTAVQMQRSYAEAAQDLADREGWDSESSRKTFGIWFEVLEGLEKDPLSIADRLDWVAKYSLIRQYEARGIGVDHPKIQALDLQYSDLRPEKSLYTKLESLGRIRRLIEPERIDAAVSTPPENTRAYLRGKLIGRWPQQVVSAGWEVLSVKDPSTDRTHRWLMDEPTNCTSEQVQHVLESSNNAHQALSRIGLRRIP